MGRLRRSGKFRTSLAKRQIHRVPILPYKLSAKKVCRLCGGAVQGRRRTWCSDECVKNWKIASDHKFRRSCVYKRDKGKCAKCQQVTDDWQVDHIKPLIQCSRADINAFLMGNLRTLCVKCHAGETKALNRKLRKEKKEWRKTVPTYARDKTPKPRHTKTLRKKERRNLKEILRQVSRTPSSNLLRKVDTRSRRPR